MTRIEQIRLSQVYTSESKYRDLFDTVVDGIFIIDEHGLFKEVNAGACAQLGYSRKELINMSVTQVSARPNLHLGELFAELEQKRSLSYQTSHRRKDGTVIPVELALTMMNQNGVKRVLGVARNIADRKRADDERQELQKQLERAQRMESLGLLAGGVAHDLNNMLGPVVGYSEMLTRELPGDSKSADRAKKVLKSAIDAAAVIQDLLTLARCGRYEMASVDVNHVISCYLDSVGFESLRERHPNVNLFTELSPSLGTILGSEVHLGKLIMNLVVNAYEAMPDGGSLTIRTEHVSIDRLYGGFQNIDSGEYVIIRVKDSGEGIAPEDLAKIFEPYFSKKKMGHSGSGLGLAVVYGIVKDHGGYYDIISEVGKGAEFVLYFPLAKDSPRFSECLPSEAAGGAETVLVVDDCSEQLALATEVLSGLGYTVLTAGNGARALEIIRQREIDIVALDMIMEPGFDGLDTLKAALLVRPHLKSVIISGYSTTDRVESALALGASALVAKPYTIDVLARALRMALDRPQAVIVK